MELENTVLSEMSQTREDKHRMTSPVCVKSGRPALVLPAPRNPQEGQGLHLCGRCVQMAGGLSRQRVRTLTGCLTFPFKPTLSTKKKSVGKGLEIQGTVGKGLGTQGKS